jgi:prepilin-type N-terminal cleavage/methylation domain-containing protein
MENILKKLKLNKASLDKLKNKILQKSKLKPAFTLIEIIVVLFVISLALLGMLSLITQNIRAQDYNKKAVIANQLSQEGVELIRRIRDNNWRNGNFFYNNLATAIGDRTSYYMDYNDSLPTILVNEDEAKLQVNDEGYFVHDPLYDDSGYRREIEVELVDDHRFRIISTVYWTSMGAEQDYKVETILYDWYQE